MAENEYSGPIDPAEALKQLNQLTTDVRKVTSPAANTFAKFLGQKATRINQGLKQIKKDVGEDHPSYQTVKAAGERIAQMNMRFKTQSTRIAKRAAPRANEWLVYGQVLNASGKPVPKLQVRIFDRDRKYDDLLGETETDENGEFSAVYHERDFGEIGEERPELYVMVNDAAGKSLYSSRDTIRFEAGKAEYFAITLGEGIKASSKESKPATKKTSQRKR